MTTVATRVRAISDLEGFDIQVKTLAGASVPPTNNGTLGQYPFEKKLKGTKTVADWRKERFERTYPGYSCDVLNGDGTTAAPQTALRTVRETYESDI